MEKISGHSGIFQVFRGVWVNTSRNLRFGRHEVCALKKKKFVFKTKTNLHSVNQKTSKGKKMKRKEMNKGTCAVKRKNCIEKFETQNLRRGIVTLVLVESTEVKNKDEGKT